MRKAADAESVTWRCDEMWRDENIKLSKEDCRNSTQWKRPLPGRPNYWERPSMRFLGDAWIPKLKACNTWTEWFSLTKEFEYSWHVLLNLKPLVSLSVCDPLAERAKRPRDDSDLWNVAWSSDTHRRLEVLGDNKVVINWMNGAWEVKGDEHAVPVRGVVDQFVRWFLGGTFRPRIDENDWCKHTVNNTPQCLLNVQRKKKDVDENVGAEQISTGRPVGLFTQLEELDIDFRVLGLPHAVVKQAENSRVRELVKKIESHPHRGALQADLQQNNVCNPFSDDAKTMIREMGNVELFEFCETIPKVQCSECILCWNQGVIYCTCGQLLVESESSHNFNQWRLGCSLNPALRHQEGARKRCIKKNYEGIHDRFPRDPVNRDSQLKIGWTEEKCVAMDKLAQEDHSHRLSYEEYVRYQKHWYLTLNKSGKNAPMRLRSDFRTAVTMMNRLHRELG